MDEEEKMKIAKLYLELQVAWQNLYDLDCRCCNGCPLKDKIITPCEMGRLE